MQGTFLADVECNCNSGRKSNKRGNLKVDSDRFTTLISKVLVFIDLLLKYRFIVYTYIYACTDSNAVSVYA